MAKKTLEAERREEEAEQPKRSKVMPDWTALRPTEMQAVTKDGHLLRIKQSVGVLGGADTYWTCYCNWRYLGSEPSMKLAQERALCGRMKAPSPDLEDWLKQFGDTLPDDLLEHEQKRLVLWKKQPKHPAVTEPAPPPATAKAGGEPVSRTGKARETNAGSKPAAKGTAEKPARAGKPSQSAVVRVVKREPTGKPGTKWRTRQEMVFSMDGRTVAAIKDNDAVAHMLRDGTIKLVEK